MTNEAVTIELIGNGNPRRFTVANGTTISGGTLLKLADPRTASATTDAAGEVFAGIAAADKLANDGATSITAYTSGIFDLKTSSVVTIGALVMLSGANTVAEPVTQAQLLAALSGGKIVGKALEQGDLAEVIAVKVGALI